MNEDYLDFLLTRETRSAPLAEPRIIAGSAALIPSATLVEVTEERVAPSLRPATPERGEVEVSPAQPDAKAFPSYEIASEFPTPFEDRMERTAPRVRLDPPPNEAPASHPVESAPPQRDPPQAAIRTYSTRIELTPAPPKATEPRTDTVPSERWFPPASLNEPDRPRIVASRDADVPKFSLPPPAPVMIRIERIEVRAAPSKAPPTPPKSRPTPRLGLEEYLKRRTAGGK